MMPKKGVLWGGVLLFLALIVPVLVGYDIYCQWQSPTMDFFLEGSGSATVHNIARGGYAEAAGLEVSDVILTVDDIPFSLWYEPEIGKTHILKVERRGEQFSLAVPAVRILQLSTSSLVSAIIVVLAFWGVGTLLLLRRFWHAEIRLLFLLSQVVAVTILFPLSYNKPFSPPLWSMSLSVASFNLAAPLLLHYALTFPVRLGRARWRRWGLALIYVTALISFGVWVFDKRLGITVSIVFFSLVVTAAILCILYVYQYRASSADRRRTRVVVFGTLIAGLPLILLYLLPSVFRTQHLIPEWLVALFLLVAPLSYLYATLRYNLFGIDRLLNRTLVYVILSLAIFIVYLAPYLFLYQYVSDNLFVQLAFIFGLTLWVGWTFDWMRTRAQRLVDQLFYGGWYDYPAVVETISDALARSSTREEVVDVLSRQIPELMRLKNSSLWIGDPNATFPSLKPSQSQARFRFQFRSDAPAQWTVGLHRDGDDLSDADQRILRTVARQAEIALNNVFMIETLRKQLDEIRASREALAQIQHRLLLSREEERSRLARDLHDGPIQLLVGLNIQLGLLQNTKGFDASTQESFVEMRSEIRQLSSELRQVCTELRPPMLDTLGLGAAIRALGEEWSAQNGADVHLALSPNADFRSLPEEVAVNFYRVAQETLINIGKHAQAKQVDFVLDYRDQRLTMTIQDDGLGFSAPVTMHGLTAQKHFGLAGMKERIDQIGGTWNLDSASGDGTTVRAAWSAKEEKDARRRT